MRGRKGGFDHGKENMYTQKRGDGRASKSRSPNKSFHMEGKKGTADDEPAAWYKTLKGHLAK